MEVDFLKHNSLALSIKNQLQFAFLTHAIHPGTHKNQFQQYNFLKMCKKKQGSEYILPI